MAFISWSVVGMNVTEAERVSAMTAGDTEAARLMSLLEPPEIRLTPDPTNSQHPSAINPALAVYATGLGANVGVHRVEPWGLIPIGTINLVDAYQKGYRYLDGKWINTAAPQPVSQIGLPTATSVPSATAIESGGPRPALLSAITDFVGGTMNQIRMTTGIGAEGGALTPIRVGQFASDLPRIIMQEVFT